jgi:diguanylate cyclase (GGDEF)-like protein/PAS domain S-box-containing protein
VAGAAIGLTAVATVAGLQSRPLRIIVASAVVALVSVAAWAIVVRRRLGRPLDHLADVDRRSVAAGAIVEGSSDLTVIMDADGLIHHASPAANAMLGRPSEWMTGLNIAGLAHPADRALLTDLVSRPAPTRSVGAPGPGGAGRLAYVAVRLSHLHGHWVDTEVRVTDLRSDPAVEGVVLNIRDVSARKALEEDLLRRALYDPLTGLANRTLFREHVEKALARLRRTPAWPHAVLFVDLDGFKTVNDSLGHAAGDQVLVEVGNRLRQWVRPGDTAARLGGDEFAVLLENTSEMDAEMLAGRIAKVLLAPILVHAKEVVITGSIGIALSETGEEADELLRNADVAMYTAKAAGKSQFRVFKPAMHHAALRRLDLEVDLRRAIDQQELFLTYQPILDLTTGRVSGMEVLVRWQHPERGLIQPFDFIPLAEDSGLIRPLGRLILEEACRQAGEWRCRFPGHGPLQLCVNASVRQIEHPGFYDEVAEVLARTGYDGRNLTLEITESLFMSDVDATVEKLTHLRELGLELAVDDFGTGYSSLSYLHSLPIDILKIDKTFVAGVTLGIEQSAVAHAVVKLAHTFNLQTVAEGIEWPDQADELRSIGADMGQGFLFSRPLRAPVMEAYLADALALHSSGPRPAVSSGCESSASDSSRSLH